jgi:glycosyltransferase involved in cell wall biosynthesis
MLYRLLARMDSGSFSSQVISMTALGEVGKAIAGLGIPVRALGMRPGRPNPIALLRLIRWLRQDRPQLIQTWLYHADLLGGLASKLVGSPPVIWGVHHTHLNPGIDRWTTILVARICASISSWIPKKIICCSESTRKAHAGLGYAQDRMIVINNGFDLIRFHPDPIARQSIRGELKIDPNTILIGMAARYHPQKDHRNFIQAAKLLSKKDRDVRFLLCGAGNDAHNDELSHMLETAGISEKTYLLGDRKDMPEILASLDIFTLSSHGEAFPNVVGEAMACGIPCVVNEVGDCREMVGDTGIVVPMKDPQGLVEAWIKLIKIGREGRIQMGEEARDRVRIRYDLSATVARYEGIYRDVAFNDR